MEKYWHIEKTNLKYHIPVHLLVCILLLFVSPFFMGVKNLTAQDTAKVLEMYVALIGIVLLTPVFLPEQDRGIRDLVCTKYLTSAVVYLVRIAGNIVLLILLAGLYIAMLKHNRCEFPMVWYFLGTYVEMLFLGGLGLFFYGLCDHLVIGYMAPVVYYMVALGSGQKYMKMFYPFSMTYGSYDEKLWLAAGAVVLIGAGVWLRCRRRAPFS